LVPRALQRSADLDQAARNTFGSTTGGDGQHVLKLLTSTV
jgi:hypothetical protein